MATQRIDVTKTGDVSVVRFRDRKILDEAAIQAQIQARADAKKAKNFAEADRIRNELLAQGIVLKDAATGTTWEATT